MRRHWTRDIKTSPHLSSAWLFSCQRSVSGRKKTCRHCLSAGAYSNLAIRLCQVFFLWAAIILFLQPLPSPGSPLTTPRLFPTLSIPNGSGILSVVFLSGFQSYAFSPNMSSPRSHIFCTLREYYVPGSGRLTPMPFRRPHFTHYQLSHNRLRLTCAGRNRTLDRAHRSLSLFM